MSSIILEDISKIYRDGDTSVKVLHSVSLEVKPGELIAVVGPSGSGKSTFLSIAGLLLSPTSGSVYISGEKVNDFSSRDVNALRREKIGFIFQNHNLLPYLTVNDQLLFSGKLSGKELDAEKKASDLLERLGLLHRHSHYPQSLSGGERQRAAIARALMNEPDILLADEPTASLESTRGRSVVNMLRDEIKLQQKAGIMVTHDERMLDLCDRTVYLENGRLIEKQRVK
ncbi:ABC transporter ATP-binding protein [Fictibacillus iocasae]|uniref:Putative hemin import ATP-binding protein HrtA n=1 Tax=Fictibacillus iocasae TaxID=2715437 RepID=A0ABW2NU34_9BACL